VLNQEFFT